jgi:predicted AAA+ superfamily ATPase
LTPLLLSELMKAADRKRHWLSGGYPDGGVLRPAGYPGWQSDYLTLLTQRDLPAWGLPARPQTTMRLLRMLAAVHGQVWNASQIGQSLGLSYKTVNGYLDYLAGAFLIRRLPSWQANIRKRLVKSPKMYWRDSGLLHSVQNVPDAETLLSRPWVGASWEGYVIEQILGTLTSRGAHFDAFYFRTSDQYELDLLLDFGGTILAFEIKLTSHPSPSDMDRLSRTAELAGATRSFLITRTSQVVEDTRRVSCDLPWLLRHLETIR